jgi:voltage-gated potassium channel
MKMNIINRQRAFEILEKSKIGDRPSFIADCFIVSCIILGSWAVILETIPGLENKYGWLFSATEIFVVTIFTVEYFLRLWASAEARRESDQSSWRARLRFVFSPLSIVDLLAIVPSYISFIFPIDIGFMRALRLLRLVKLGHYFPTLRILNTILVNEARSLVSILFVVMLMLGIASSGIYAFERDAQPEVFSSIPAAMWWALATLTTVGYGDVTPITIGGKIFAGFVIIVGIGIVALPAGLLASAFSDELKRRQKRIEEKVRDAMADGIVKEGARARLNFLAGELGFEEKKIDEILSDLQSREHQQLAQCPHCGEKL